MAKIVCYSYWIKNISVKCNGFYFNSISYLKNINKNTEKFQVESKKMKFHKYPLCTYKYKHT